MFPTKVVQNNETKVLSNTQFLSVRSTVYDISELKYSKAITVTGRGGL
jgi:hypothetical protein